MRENPRKDAEFEVKQLRPGESGIRKALFDLEADIMEVLWRKSRRASVREIHEVLERGRTIAYTTVMTTMDRLWKKGLLLRESEAKAYLYWPKHSQDEFHRLVAAQVVDSLMPEVSEPLLASFVDATAQASPDHLDRLEELIRLKRKELEQESGG